MKTIPTGLLCIDVQKPKLLKSLVKKKANIYVFFCSKA